MRALGEYLPGGARRQGENGAGLEDGLADDEVCALSDLVVLRRAERGRDLDVDGDEERVGPEIAPLNRDLSERRLDDAGVAAQGSPDRVQHGLPAQYAR